MNALSDKRVIIGRVPNDQKFLEKLEYSAVTAARLTKIASGFRHIPQVRLV